MMRLARRVSYVHMRGREATHHPLSYQKGILHYTQKKWWRGVSVGLWMQMIGILSSSVEYCSDLTQWKMKREGFLMCVQHFFFSFLWPLRRPLLLSLISFFYHQRTLVSSPHHTKDSRELESFILTWLALSHVYIRVIADLEVQVGENHCHPHHHHNRIEKGEQS